MKNPALVALALLIATAACAGDGSAGNELREGSPTRGATSTSLDFVETTEQLRNDCAAAARTLGFPVPCPTALPTTAEPVRCEVPAEFENEERRDTCVFGQGFLLAPKRFVASNPSNLPDHLLIEANPAPGWECRRVTAVKLSFRTVERVYCEGGLHHDHTGVGWTIEDVHYLVSVHGESEASATLVARIVEHIEMVEP